MTASTVWDILVAGAGPAGSRVAALLAARGCSVLMLDPRAPWEKPCGGGLTAGALDHTPELLELAAEGEWVRELLIVTEDRESRVVRLGKPYLVVSRQALSQWGLARARAAGAVFRPATVRTAERDGGSWRVTDAEGNEHRARHLVGADGAASRLRTILAPRFKPELTPTRVVYPSALRAPTGRAVFALIAEPKGYVWDFERPGHHSVGVWAASGPSNRGDLDRALAEFECAGPSDGQTVRRSDGRTVGRSDPSLPQDAVHEVRLSEEPRGAAIASSIWKRGRFADLSGRDYALLGDAAGFADPATGEGLDYAFRSATIAAQVFDQREGFTRYAGAAQRAFRREMLRASLARRLIYHTAAPGRLLRWAERSPRGARFLQRVTDAVNEHRSLLRAALAGG